MFGRCIRQRQLAWLGFLPPTLGFLICSFLSVSCRALAPVPIGPGAFLAITMASTCLFQTGWASNSSGLKRRTKGDSG